MQRRWRSHLIFSALNMRHMGTAFESGADAVACDLEDSVPVDRKVEARLELIKYLHDYGVPKKIQVRINHYKYMPSGVDELKQLREAGVLDLVSEIILPKITSREEILDNLGRERDFPCVVVIEEAAAVVNLEDICSLRNVRAIILGRSDMSRALGLTDRCSDLTYIRQKMAVVGHAYGVQVGDCCHIVRDKLYMESTWNASLSFGMTFGACVHPSQVPIANKIFQPGELYQSPGTQVKEWCKDVIAAEDKTKGLPYIHDDGGVVGTPHYRAARNILQ